MRNMVIQYSFLSFYWNVQRLLINFGSKTKFMHNRSTCISIQKRFSKSFRNGNLLLTLDRLKLKLRA